MELEADANEELQWNHEVALKLVIRDGGQLFACMREFCV